MMAGAVSRVVSLHGRVPARRAHSRDRSIKAAKSATAGLNDSGDLVNVALPSAGHQLLTMVGGQRLASPGEEVFVHAADRVDAIDLAVFVDEPRRSVVSPAVFFAREEE